ncbi:hypothetical protein AOQ72_07530 [Bradyrhizobium yuanmingense]|uniref:Uncharacterized protein n=1 Tax=Bradyrhizobium yuanmingense TaxID=108015 RepID=A0A0R3D3B4_9BRAD|nr:hypothetical protein AOQ72_07530 [Bradyrhizobium yuanmingense]
MLRSSSHVRRRPQHDHFVTAAIFEQDLRYRTPWQKFIVDTESADAKEWMTTTCPLDSEALRSAGW